MPIRLASMADEQTIPTPIAEIDHGPSKFDEFMNKHQKKLIILTILAVIGILGYVIFDGIQKSKNETAGTALVEAEDEEALKKMIQDHNVSSSKSSAYIRLANMQAATEPSEAIKTLDNFISSYQDHPSIKEAELNRALLLANSGKKDDAKLKLEELIADSDAAYLSPLAAYALANILGEEGDNAAAAEVYQKIENLNNGKSYQSLRVSAKRQLKILNIKEAVEITPAPPVIPATPGAAPGIQGIPGVPTSPLAPTTPTAPSPIPNP